MPTTNSPASPAASNRFSASPAAASPATRPRRVLGLVLALPLLWGAALGCSDGTNTGDGTADLAVTADLATAAADLAKPADLAAVPDLATARCELPYELRPIKTVSTGAFTSAPSPGNPQVRTAEIDATAGGYDKYQDNPFVYVDLINNKKVEINDVQAQTSKDWDIAFKRWQIKINSGDSGPGGVTAASVDDKNLDEVAAAPTDPNAYGPDKYFDAMCKVQYDSIFGPKTRLSDWYDYTTGSPVPFKRVYVLKRRDGQGSIKLQITQYYKGSAGGNYGITWSLLP